MEKLEDYRGFVIKKNSNEFGDKEYYFVYNDVGRQVYDGVETLAEAKVNVDTYIGNA